MRSYRNGVPNTGTESWLRAGMGPISIVYAVIMALLFVAVAVLSIRHAERPGRPALAGLWVTAVLLLGGTIISVAGVGFLLASGSLVALLTAIVATTASVSTRDMIRPRVAHHIERRDGSSN
jgi:hypothetical protein